jgi:hypothetical protein
LSEGEQHEEQRTEQKKNRLCLTQCDWFFVAEFLQWNKRFFSSESAEVIELLVGTEE